MSSIDAFQIDKNAMNSVEIIQMTYLDFLFKMLIPSDEANLLFDKTLNILKLSLGWDRWNIKLDEKKRVQLINDEGAVINGKQFEDIRRIILYQNIPSFNDEYIDPDLKKSMAEVDRLKALNIEPPSLERKMAIVTAHCGLSKFEQMKMTIRAHQLLFNECAAEVEFTTTRPIANLYILASNRGNNHWGLVDIETSHMPYQSPILSILFVMRNTHERIIGCVSSSPILLSPANVSAISPSTALNLTDSRSQYAV